MSVYDGNATAEALAQFDNEATVGFEPVTQFDSYAARQVAISCLLERDQSVTQAMLEPGQMNQLFASALESRTRDFGVDRMLLGVVELGYPMNVGTEALVVTLIGEPRAETTEFYGASITTSSGPQFETVGWIPEAALAHPVGGGLRGTLAALKGLLSQHRRTVGGIERVQRIDVEPDAKVLEEMASQMGLVK